MRTYLDHCGWVLGKSPIHVHLIKLINDDDDDQKETRQVNVSVESGLRGLHLDFHVIVISIYINQFTNQLLIEQ